MTTLEHCTLQFLVQMKKINLPSLILQHMKLNKFSTGGIVTKILRRAGVDFESEEKKYGAKISKFIFFGLKIN